MFQLNAKTRTASILSEAGTSVRLDHPQFLAECDGDRVPYVMPAREGGYLIFVEYGDPCSSESTPTDAGAGCGCDTDPCAHKKTSVAPASSGIQRLLAIEVVAYSGYQEDAVTVNITQRGLEGTSKRAWPAGSLVIQSMTGSELKDVLNWLKSIQSFLDSLGCILAVPTEPKTGCGGWNKGEWACFGGKYYRSKENGNCTTAPGDKWECEADVFSLLNLHCDWLKTCKGERLPLGSQVLRQGDLKNCKGDPITCEDKLARCEDIDDPIITDLSHETNYDNGTIKIISSDGEDTVINVLDPKLWPSAHIRVSSVNNKGVSGLKPPNMSLQGGISNLDGGFTYNEAGELVMPYDRRYRVLYRPATIAKERKLYPVGERCTSELLINGEPARLEIIADDHVGIHENEELNDFKVRHFRLKKGDRLNVRTDEESANHWLDAYDLEITTLST